MITLADAIAALESDRLKERETGIENLKHVLKSNQRSSGLGKLKDKTYHAMFESLFRLLAKEKSAYLRASKSNHKLMAASRLSSYAEVFRYAVETTVSYVRLKTLKALVVHIVQTLPVTHSDFCQPMVFAYLKAMAAITSYQPHVEHLPKDDWYGSVDLCLQAILASLGDVESQQTSGFGANQALISFGHGSQLRNKRSEESSINVTSSLQSLRNLLFASNCPILTKSSVVLRSIIDFLHANPFSSGSYEAFSVMNLVLSRSSMDCGGIALKSVRSVLPLIKVLWPQKDPVLRDEMLKTLVLSESMIAKLVRVPTTDVIENISSLLEVMTDDYFHFEGRGRRHLTLEELDFGNRTGIPAGHAMPMRIRHLCLRRSTEESDHNWTLLYFMALFTNHVDRMRLKLIPEESDVPEETPRKRRKVGSKYLDLLQSSSEAAMPMRIYSLQLLAFTIDQVDLDSDQMQDTLMRLIPMVMHPNTHVSSWALLAISCCAGSQARFNHSGIWDAWTSIWQSTFRLISSVSHSRIACHTAQVLMDSERLPANLVMESFESLLESGGVDGPASASDASTVLWKSVRHILLNQGSSRVISRCHEQMFGWLSAKWIPSNFENRAYSVQIVRTLSPFQLCQIIQTCTLAEGVPLVPNEQNTPLGSIGQVWLEQCLSQPLRDYLMLENDTNELFRTGLVERFPHVARVASIPNKSRIISNMIVFLSTELERTLETLQSYIDGPSRIVSSDMLQLLFSLYLACELVSRWHIQDQPGQCDLLQQKASKLGKFLCAYLSKSSTEQVIVDDLLIAIAPFLPGSLQLPFEAHQASYDESLVSVFNMVCSALDRRHEALENTKADVALDEDDDMDIDSHPQSNQIELPLPEYLRHTVSAHRHPSAIAMVTDIHLHYLISLSYTRTTDTPFPMHSAFVEYLCNLHPSKFCSIRGLLLAFDTSEVELDAESAEQLLDHVMRSFLEPYEYERCEVALCICLDVLRLSVSHWVDRKMESLNEIGCDLYAWFVDTAFAKGACSVSVQMRLSSLLMSLLKIRSDHILGDSKPSVRTTLLEILKYGQVSVQHHIAKELPSLFGMFVLTQHEKIFEDIRSSLAADSEWIEGMAMRVLVFCILAESWDTLLRRCIYHTFEVAGSMHEAGGYATLCMRRISRSLHLKNPRMLFRLFSSQIIFTWTRDQGVEELPWYLFDYHSLKEIVVDAQQDIIGQAVLRNDGSNIQQACHLLETSEVDIMVKCFPQVTAFAFASDVSDTSSQSGPNHTSENRIREVLGKERFAKILESRFPFVIGHLFRRLEREHDIVRGFNKRRNYTYAAKSFEAMVGGKVADSDLPASQQPSFESKFLVDEIERLCRRAGKDSSKMWTASLVTIVARMILDDMIPVLGSFHARRQLQRIRILVCLAGSTVLHGYPLELLLHALRPHLTNSYSAQDAIGIFKYLFGTGTDYLVERPSFVVGTCVASLLCLRKFLKSTQDSTTQESHHRATLSQAQDFHRWLGQKLEDYDTSFIPASCLTNFQGLSELSRSSSSAGTAKAHTPEAKLLLALLTDLKPQRRLLTRPMLELCFVVLCEDFHLPETFREDLLNTDDLARRYALQVWKSSRLPGISKTYQIWAAKVLGRVFASQGNVAQAIAAESNFAAYKERTASSSSIPASTAGIIGSFLDLLQSEDSSNVSLAEKTLRRILFEQQNTEEGSLVQDYTGEHVTVALMPTPEMDMTEELSPLTVMPMGLLEAFERMNHKSSLDWIRDIDLSLVQGKGGDPILQSISKAIESIPVLSESLFPFILERTIERGHFNNKDARLTISDGFRHSLQSATSSHAKQIRHLLDAFLYLRSRPRQGELSMFDRNYWLDLDFFQAAEAARMCKMFKTALLLIEIGDSVLQYIPKSVTSTSKVDTPALLASLFKEIEDPDYFHGVSTAASLESVAENHAFEGNGTHELLLRGAQADSALRMYPGDQPGVLSGVINSLSRLNLSGLTQALSANQNASFVDDSVIESMTNTALKLGQWDFTPPTTITSDSSSIFRSFQMMREAHDLHSLQHSIDSGIYEIYGRSQRGNLAGHSLQKSFAALAAMVEVGEIVSSRDTSDLFEISRLLERRQQWMGYARSDIVSRILSCREAAFGILSNDDSFKNIMKLDLKATRLLGARMDLEGSKTFRLVGSMQESLAVLAHLSNLVEPYQLMGLTIGNAVKKEMANTLWSRDEIIPAIRMLQQLKQVQDLDSQSIPVGRAGLLATLGHHTSQARLQKPDDILNEYLSVAQTELHGNGRGEEAGNVFHELASYCHGQLLNPENVQEFQRSEAFKERRIAEIRELETVIRGKISDDQKHRAKLERNKARKWLEIDRVENDRLNKTREQFLRQSLENYLLCLAASDEHDTDVLRFVALWLEHADHPKANDAVSKAVSRVPSRKFASLMNQLASRLQDTDERFQQIMSSLVERVCTDHPFHGMYHIFAGSKTTGGNDRIAMSRNVAAVKVADRLHCNDRTSKVWKAVSRSNELYIKLAHFKNEATNASARLQLRKFPVTKAVERDIPDFKVPPITIALPLRPSCNYDNVPIVKAFKPDMTIAGGISTPKILTAVSSNGTLFKQLFKAGQDDLRQDAIMEQVFEQVSDLLQQNKATKQRALRIRTYKVIPLTASAGAIEFVQNTIPVNDWLRPAHVRYNPKDYRWDICRTRIDQHRASNLDTRVNTYKDIAHHFHPVLRHFFFEKFDDPDDWFDKRLAYTRSTAAISMLGHIVGLGDRHCQNILLDTSTGEAVHIDLGVAFEAGRILQVPEVVPFRLTRDIVDAFGITGTEGVFRRCCEVTLEALRGNKDAIMTLLNVLRYDPLYSWSMSPLRAKRLQDEQDREAREQAGQTASTPSSASRSVRRSRGGEGDEGTGNGEKKAERSNQNSAKGEDGGEADRALSVVERKLAPGLSVMATVNELIQQATDERNLAVLFCGWAAFA